MILNCIECCVCGVLDQGLGRESIDQLVSCVVTYADVRAQYGSLQHKDMVSSCCEQNARSLVTVVSWLQHDVKYLTSLASQVSRACYAHQNVARCAVSNCRSRFLKVALPR